MATAKSINVRACGAGDQRLSAGPPVADGPGGWLLPGGPDRVGAGVRGLEPDDLGACGPGPVGAEQVLGELEGHLVGGAGGAGDRQQGGADADPEQAGLVGTGVDHL